MPEIDVLGYVVASEDEWIYRWFGYDCVSPRSMRKALATANGVDVTVRINSYGGLTWAASEIYTSLRQYTGEVAVEIVGLAASAAGVIALAGDIVRMAPTAEFMMHNPYSQAEGDYRDMEHAAQSLSECRETIINAFALRCKNLTRAEIGDMLDNETWMGAQKAIAAGVADEMLFAEGVDSSSDANGGEQGEAAAAESSGGSGARAAALRMPSAALLKAQKTVWDAIAPGAAGINEAKAMLNAMRAPALEVAPEAASDPDQAEPETAPEVQPESERLDALRTQIDILGVY